MTFFSRLLSVDELRVSSLVICLLAGMTLALYRYHTFGDISSNFLTLLITLITAISGVNLGNIIVRGINDYKESNGR